MKAPFRTVAFGAAMLAGGAWVASAQQAAPHHAVGQTAAQPPQVINTPDEIAWRDGPASLPEGAEMAPLFGNAAEEGMFAMRLRLPANYTIPPHIHPQPEIVTVISGTFHLGMGETVDRDRARELPAGSFFALPSGMTHFAFTTEETVVQINSTGPWALIYVNPADDPRRQAQAGRPGGDAATGGN